MGITNAKVFPLPVTCESGNSVSPPSSPETSLENNELDEGKASHRFCSHIFVTHEERDGRRLKKREASHEQVKRWQISQRRNSRHQARCEHHPSRAGGKVTDAASLDATGAGDCRDRGAATATGPGAPQTAPALLPQPGLPFPGSPAPAPGSSGGSGAPAAPAARAGSAAPAASSSCPQSPPPSWPGGVTAPPLPRPGAAAPALGGNANRGTFRSAAHQFRHPPPGVIALVKSKLWI